MDASETIPSFCQSRHMGTDEATGKRTNKEVAVIPQQYRYQSLVEEPEDHHTVVRTPAEEWSQCFNKLPAFTVAMIDNHLIYKSSTMPDKQYSQAYRYEEKSYRLFKEGCVQKLFMKAHVTIRNIS